MSTKDPTPITSADVHELENGVFNLVVTFVKQLQETVGPENARNYVAQYLEHLAKQLSAFEQTGE